MPDTTFKRSPADDPARLEQMKELLSRYPDIDDSEKDEIVHYLKKGPPLDAALLSTLERIKPQLARFREEHRRHFALGAKEYALVAVFVVALVALLALLWDAGLK
ncbi:hypothetical protein [Sphingosinicella rhizophila]|uniref:Uncharacterized protein n=1 Tax=Sphingosinicella rhizophila TaxID=3050082 RepID=A0ABU3QCD0_9SPHN|nr:hypothetical protein [Sphingosinicella sp. GR2756]MDT9601055.1 hypothetical protein [Sphingosinicella sp. GR2756]